MMLCTDISHKGLLLTLFTILPSVQILQPNARGKHQQSNNSCADGNDTIGKTGETCMYTGL